MFSVTGLEFSFTQAPPSMKSVIQALWLLNVAFGNVIVVIVAELRAFKSQAHEFFLFALLMFIDMGLFSLLSLRYKYVEYQRSDTENIALESGKKDDHRKEGVTNQGFTTE